LDWAELAALVESAVFLTVYTVFAVKNYVLTCYGVWVVLEAVAIEKKVERGAIGLTFN
jgi:hypothetical protein